MNKCDKLKLGKSWVYWYIGLKLPLLILDMARILLVGSYGPFHTTGKQKA